MTKKQQRKEIEWAIDQFPGWKKQILACEACADALGSRLQQIKEKFGSLRFYHSTHNWSTEPYGPEYIIIQMEADTQHTCFMCGEEGKTRKWGGGWLYTLCEKHGEELRNKNIKRMEGLRGRVKYDPNT